jgi:transglutaminase-like putative cysteine protease
VNPRLTLTAATAVILASVSVYPLIDGWGWFWAGVGAVLTVAAAGTLTRLATWPAAVAATVLAFIACWPLLASPPWYGRAAGVLIVALAAASLTRFRVLPTLAILITYLAALLIYLNAVFAAGRSAIGFVPTRASVHSLWLLASGGLSERRYEPPVPGTHGIVLLAAAGIGVMAVATDLLAVRLRSPAIAGLPLLALYSVPITTNTKQGGIGATVVFCLGVGGYLALLAADSRDRLRIWGRLVSVWQNKETEAVQKPDTRALAASGRRIGLAAISIAILVPVLIPGIRVHGLFNGGAAPGSPGQDRVQLPNPLVQMEQQLKAVNPQTVLSYTTDAPDPASQYLQVYVLNYDGLSGTWNLVTPGHSVSVGHEPLQAAPGVAASTPEVTTHTRVKFASGVSGYGTRLSFLALPYAPTRLTVTGDWHQDKATLMVYSTSTPLSNLTYSVTSRAAEPSGDEPAEPARGPTAASTDGYLTQPSTDLAQLAELASRITKSASTSFTRAVALERYFTTGNGFRYSLNVRVPDNTAGLLEFLTKTKRGFCQQFAFAMAVLARLVGIPSRIAVGYTAGVNEGNGTWKVFTTDAHAWPELYFAGAGWLRFEPTPSGAGGQATAVQPDYAALPGLPAQTGPAQGRGATPNISGRGSTAGGIAKLNHLATGETGRAGSAGSRRGGGSPLGLIAVVVLGLALVSPATARIVVRRRRWRRARDDISLADAAWRELQDDLTDYGMACRPSESPRAVARRIAPALGLDDSTRQALERIASAEERARYATAPQPSATLHRDVTTMRQALALEADRAMRWRARLLPASMLAPTRAALYYALDVFGWMDAAGQRLRRRTLASRPPGLADRPG